MFKLDENEEIIIKNWPVIISKPQDGGTQQKHQITADFLLLPDDKLEELMAASRESENGNVDRDIARRVVVKISGVAGADNTPLEFNAELLEKLLNKRYVRSALVATYFDAVNGKKAKTKN